MRVYISGPITGHDDYMWKFAEVEKHLADKGYNVANPAALNEVMPKDASYEDYMTMCFQLLDICDAIYMLEGWQQSLGANREYGYAKAKQMVIMEHPHMEKKSYKVANTASWEEVMKWIGKNSYTNSLESISKRLEGHQIAKSADEQ